MKARFQAAALAFVLASAFAATAHAQQPAAPTAPPPTEAAPGTTEAAPGAADANRPPLDVELETGGYAYNSGGRRDPFVSLQRPVAADRGPKTRKPGMEGFLIQEIALKGIVRTTGSGIGIAGRAGHIAMFLGADGKSYFVTTGQRLYDGVITAVDATSVTFRQEVTDPLSPVKTREVRKSLYASEEAR
jgi:Tfp pilus assembly protein PilP